MSFFESEVVRAEMTEISELQEDVYRNVFNFPTMNREEKLFHVGLLEKLIEKQKILYARLSLSDDPEAKLMKKNIVDSAQMMGLSSEVDMNVVFSNMSKMLDVMRSQIDKDDNTLQNIRVHKSQIQKNLTNPMSFANLKKQSSLGSLTSKLVKEVEKMNNTGGGGDDRLWKPEMDKTGNGYAVIRFLPAPNDEELPWAKMYSHAFQGPGGWYIENSLTTIGQKDHL